LAQQRDAAQARCTTTGGAETGVITATGATIPGVTPTAPVVAEATTLDGPGIGRILYSAVDPVSLRNEILVQAVGKSTPAQLILQDAAQPAFRADGARLAFRNLRGNMAGLSGFDPATGLMLRFSEYAEDALPSWNAQGSRIAFASNREGDRRWRVYTVWAEVNGATDMLGFGEAPAWHPALDQIAFRGCDESGNGCGIWTMSGAGNNHVPLTTMPEDTRPAWAPDGTFVVFMSAGRDGNFEIYRVDAATRAVTRLTDTPAIDALPTVSPDGEWVGFVSNRDGEWALWAAPSAGGPAVRIAPIMGDLGDWSEQALQWVY
jgi:TolB protein